jgi:hypothetical protein
MWRKLTVLLICPLVGCFNAVNHARNGSIRPANDRSEIVAVLPFTGTSGLERGAGEWFAHRLERNARYKVLTPGAVESLEVEAGTTLEAQFKGSTGASARMTEARRRGALLSARVVVVGEYEWQWVQFKVTLIDVVTGEEVAQTSARGTFNAGLAGIYPTTVTAVEELAQWTLDEIAARSAAAGTKR